MLNSLIQKTRLALRAPATRKIEKLEAAIEQLKIEFEDMEKFLDDSVRDVVEESFRDIDLDALASIERRDLERIADFDFDEFQEIEHEIECISSEQEEATDLMCELQSRLEELESEKNKTTKAFPKRTLAIAYQRQLSFQIS